MTSLPIHHLSDMNGDMGGDAFKKNLLLSPMSQASTAASSPSISPCDQPMRSRGFTSFTLASQVAEVSEDAEAENDDLENVSTGDSMAACRSTDEDESTDENKGQYDEEDGDVMIEESLECTEVVVDDPLHVVSAGVPPLQSELGQWAKKVVQAEMWFEAQQRKKQRSAGDNSAADKEVDWEGPALEFGGRALDLDGGKALFFSHDKELASGQADKVRTKEIIQMIRAAQLAHAACEAEARIEAGEICSIDQAGVLHGDIPAFGKTCTPAMRLKAIHRRRQRRQHGSTWTQPNAPVLCADESGKVSLYVYVNDPSKRRLRCAQLAHPRSAISPTVLEIDAEGTVQIWPTICLDSDGNVR